MKWVTPAKPTDGTKRKRKKFAWFPVKCSDGTMRWLEFIFVTEGWYIGTRRWWVDKYESKDEAEKV